MWISRKLKAEADRAERTIQNSLHKQNSREFLVFVIFFVVVFFYWYLVNIGEMHEGEYTLEPQLENVPSDVIVTESPTPTLTVTYEAKGEKILEYRTRKNLHNLSIDYRKNIPTDGHYMLTGQALKDMLSEHLPGAEILSVQPDTLQYYVAPSKGRRLPIRLQGTISADNDHTVNEIRISPDSVTVFAPHAVIDTMHAVYTHPLSLTSLSDSVSQAVSLILPVRGTLYEPSEAMLDVIVSPYVIKTIEVPIRPYMFPYGQVLKTFPSKAQVSFLVSLKEFRDIEVDDFELVVNYNNLNTTKSEKARLELIRKPEKIKSISLNPEEVEYLLESAISLPTTNNSK